MLGVESGKRIRAEDQLLVAGEVHRAPRPQAMRLLAEAGGVMKAAPPVQEQALYDYHMYTLPGRTTLKDKQTGYTQTLPLLCQHCAEPPCVDVCPTGASFKRADGIVLVDKHICIGCRYCMMACPYKARSFIHEDLKDQKPWAPRGKGTVESCTMCVHRVDHGGTPACVEACSGANHNALVFGDLYDDNSEISQQLREHGGKEIRGDLDLNTGVRYRGI